MAHVIRQRVDLRELVSGSMVASASAVPETVAIAVIDAYRMAVTAVAVGGGSVVMPSDVVYGPRDSGQRRWIERNLGDVLESFDAGGSFAQHVDNLAVGAFGKPYLPAFLDHELNNLVVHLASVREPNAALSDLERTLDEFRRLLFELVDEGPSDAEVVWGRVWSSLERDFEDWLVADLSVFDEFGWSLELVARQWRAPDRTVADLLCRARCDSSEASAGDLVVVENKAVEATAASVQQLTRYIAHVRAEHPGSVVHGILVAPGFGDQALDAVGVAAVSVLTWGDLGFLDHLWRPDIAHRTIRSAVA